MGQLAQSAPLRLGIAGLGTVGTGVVKIIQSRGNEIARRLNRSVEIVAVSARSAGRDRGVDLSAYAFETDPVALAGRPDIDVVLELIGGSEGPALELVTAALQAGKSVVTANKALIAHHGTALARLAESRGVTLAYEAAVAGGIPIIKAMREGVAANSISRVYGILNGTCNYILSEMESTGRAFEDVLADAQAKGYAEADPSFDIGGVDAAHKLAILAAIAFGNEVDFGAVQIEGIESITAEDIASAHELGYRIKLIGQAQPADGGIEQRVSPALVPLGTPIAEVNGVFNAVVMEGNFVGRVFLEGRGAGEGPTASAVMADVLDIARGDVMATFGIPVSELNKAGLPASGSHMGEYFVRLNLQDEPGGIAMVTAAFAEEKISIAAMEQKERAGKPGAGVPVTIVTHECREDALMRALDKIGAATASLAAPRMIRIAAF